ncbi:hypothetical protein PoB_006039500 [Plakobranchus ocellatus]|uniref:Uncharacterized protein n=1 Tax=Plakobranchus ocellatus TaxID=259542 RepID=A0AAV4CPY8_9GAST|nr:hypothetical protein PoB_006039500 [Plakobranchus ocellatus]
MPKLLPAVCAVTKNGGEREIIFRGKAIYIIFPSPDDQRGMDKPIPKRSDLGHRVLVWMDRRLLLPAVFGSSLRPSTEINPATSILVISTWYKELSPQRGHTKDPYGGKKCFARVAQ